MDTQFPARRFAHVMAVITLMGAVALPIFQGGAWIFLDEFTALGVDDWGFSFDAASISTPARIAGFLVAVSSACIQAFGLMAVRATFMEAALGRALSLRAVVQFRRFAWISVVMVFVGIIQNSAYSVIFSWGNPEGSRQLEIEFGSNELSTLFVALLFMFVAHVFATGRKIEEENATFI